MQIEIIFKAEIPKDEEDGIDKFIEDFGGGFMDTPFTNSSCVVKVDGIERFNKSK